MSYRYAIERHKVFTEDGVEMLLKILDKARAAIELGGSVTMSHLYQAGDSWTTHACVDYLCEQGILVEVTGENTPGQWRVFRDGKR